jgi:hypothetical protein
LAACLAAAAQVAAQEESLPALEFSFSNPGARSMGFGGAFVALADDATAAVANPAGLVQLVEPEISLEGRYWDYSTPNVEGGRIFGPPTGEGLDVSPGLRVGESSQQLSGLSFLSLVHSARRWSLAFYRHQLANYEYYGETGALFAGPWPGFPGSRARSWDLRKAIDLEIVSYGITGAYRVTEKLSLGVGVSYFDGSMEALTESFAPYASDEPTDFEFYHAESLFAPELLVQYMAVDLDDSDLVGLVGILLRLTESWSLGGVIREGPHLASVSEVRAGPVHDSHSAGELLQFGSGEVEFPDVFGVGASFRSRDGRVTIGFEWDRVTYSDILESTGAPPEFELDDGNEWRLGGEYAFLDSRPIVALRLGAWLDPAHRIGYSGGDYVAQAVLDAGSDELHLAGGLGIAFKRFQIDLGIDVSDPVNTASISAIYSF